MRRRSFGPVLFGSSIGSNSIRSAKVLLDALLQSIEDRSSSNSSLAIQR